MAKNLEPEEAEAIRDLLEGGGGAEVDVVDRDFRKPRRLSAGRLELLLRRVRGATTSIEEQLSAIIGKKCPVEVASIDETSAEGLFTHEGPFAAIRLDVGGQPGWVVWESGAAVRAVERVLGSTATTATARRFSAIECTVVESLLATFADAVLRAIDVEADGVLLGQTREALGDWREGTHDPDPHRLHIEISVEGPGDPSIVNAYIPLGSMPTEAGAKALTAIELPSHLDDVEIELSVRIEGCAVSLEQLIALEEGDVIPLDARVGEPAQLCVDGRVIGSGTTGTRGGNLAVRVESLSNESLL